MFVAVILVTLVIFPSRSWLCMPTYTTVQIMTSPCDDTIHVESTAFLTGFTVFSLLTPTAGTGGLNVGVSPLPHPPLLNPQELFQQKIDPPPRLAPPLAAKMTLG